MEYNPKNWFWIVAGDEQRLFASATGDYVAPTAPAYLAFIAAGGFATRIASEAELGAVLAPHRVRPVHAGVLEAYLTEQAQDVVDAVQFKVLFQHENRIRAIERALNLNGSPANLTAAQARNAVKVLL